MRDLTRQEFIAEWIKALRSGEYKKTEHRFLGNEGDTRCYCTLGLAANIIDPDYVYVVPAINKMEELVPELSCYVGTLWDDITNRNDGENGFKPHTFEQMADFLEEKL